MKKIKQLQWIERLGYTNSNLDLIYSFSGDTLYINDFQDYTTGDEVKNIATLEEAKIIAQKHFEDLIMSCFEDE